MLVSPPTATPDSPLKVLRVPPVSLPKVVLLVLPPPDSLPRAMPDSLPKVLLVLLANLPTAVPGNLLKVALLVPPPVANLQTAMAANPLMASPKAAPVRPLRRP